MGDVAVFLGPRNRSSYFVSRLIGLPGDRVQLREGTLYINGGATKREPQGEYADSLAKIGKRGMLARFTETLPNGIAHSILLDRSRVPRSAKPCDRQNEDSGDAENTCFFVVPPDHYLMMGDNRDDSFDSRFPDYGFIARDGLVGRVDLVAGGSTQAASARLCIDVHHDAFALGSARPNR
jgi:signal peptidase I